MLIATKLGFDYDLPILVLNDERGFYIGVADENGPVTCESVEFYLTAEDAEHALQNNTWTQRQMK